MLAALLILIVLAAPADLRAQTIFLKDAFPALTFPGPVDLQNAGDGTNRLFIVRQAGLIMVVAGPGAATQKVFLNIDPLVESGGELGLLGLAFHPSYETNGYFYLNYTAADPLRTVIARYKVSDTNPDSADPASATILLEYGQPFTNHNGGQVAFGPDGYLYIAAGDGGSGGDPGNRAQDLTTPLGKLLRIDVDHPADSLQYSIPPTNPWAGNTDGYREEIFAYGLRNPWRFSFDPATGSGWIGDVGQGDWEEVDTLAIGANYGWRLKEGDHCYNPPADCDTITGLTDPVWEYAHDGAGGCSITGGYVYRGTEIPALVDKFLFGDYCSGRIWTIDVSGAGGWAGSLLLDSSKSPYSFGVDRAGEIYVCSGNDARVYRLAVSHPPVPTPRSPGDGSIDVPRDTTLRWSQSPGAIGYHLQVASDTGFSSIIREDTSLTDTSSLLTALPGSETLHWRVRARNTVGWSPFSAVWTFTTVPVEGVSVSLRGGWNMVSLPVDSSDAALGSLYAGVISAAFRYFPDSGYAPFDTLEPGVGYWVKFSNPQVAGFSGVPRTLDTLEMAAGWSLVGGLSVDVDADSVESIPPGIVASPFYGYDGSYVTIPTLEPGRSYWVKCTSPGSLVLRGGGTAPPPPRSR